MATETFHFTTFLSGQIRVEYDLNTGNWRPSQVRVINSSPSRTLAFEVLESGSPVYSNTAPPNQTSTWNISGIQLGWQAQYFNEDTQEWEDGGIDLGNYELRASIN